MTSKRIEKKKEKLAAFSQFLERARDDNIDEFKELQEILSRFETLRNENRRLMQEKAAKDRELNEI